MFRDIISSTPFADPNSDVVFPKIPVVSYNGDISFVSTLRAVVHPYIPDGEKLNLVFDKLFRASADEIANTVFSKRYGYGTYAVYSYHTYSTENVEAALNKKIAENGLSLSFERLEKVTGFYRNSFPVYCYRDVANKTVVLLVESMDMKRMHYLQLSIPSTLSWYIKFADLSKQESDVLLAMSKDDPAFYRQAIQVLADELNMNELRVRSLLDGFERRIVEQSIASVEYDLDNQNSLIEAKNREIGELLYGRERLLIKLLGYQAKKNKLDGDCVLTDYFLNNKSVSLEGVNGSIICVIVKSYLEYFDEEAARDKINDNGSDLYDTSNLSEEGTKRLFEAIFIEKINALRFCAAYTMDIRRTVEPYQGYIFGEDCSGYMPNPHIQRYHCGGGYVQVWNECMKNHNYIGALEQCVASCQNLSILDGIVFRSFVNDLCNQEIKCLELPDGSVVCASEAVEWLTQTHDKTEGTKNGETD